MSKLGILMRLLLLLPLIFATSCTKVDSKVSKHKFLESNHPHAKKMGKTRSYMQIMIQDVSKNEQTLDLRATVNPSGLFEGAQVEWKLPDSVEVVSGSSTQTLDLQPGHLQELEISLNRENLKDQDQIFLFIYKMKDGERHGSTASFIYRISQDEENIKQKTLKNPKIVE